MPPTIDDSDTSSTPSTASAAPVVPAWMVLVLVLALLIGADISGPIPKGALIFAIVFVAESGRRGRSFRQTISDRGAMLRVLGAGSVASAVALSGFAGTMVFLGAGFALYLVLSFRQWRKLVTTPSQPRRT